ncbi:hypothetical protein C8F01DRAFT_1232670 [Mycena amicta]|nr:hypothetical protein C8F01DRAFT_1232670 [Mycena amicta]
MSLCSKCGTLVPEEVFTKDALRSRLYEIELLIDALVAEREHLLAQSKAITYPVLSLPTEITAHIFLHCVGAARNVGGKPEPRPSEAPLLLLRICREWRTIVLGTPALWANVSVGNELPANVHDLWLGHAKLYPLDLYVHLNNPTLATRLVAVCLKYAANWRDVSLGIPLIAYEQLIAAIAQSDFVLPILRDAAFRIHHPSNQGVDGVVTIRDAPALRKLAIVTLPYLQISAPWGQLTFLELRSRLLLGACLGILAQCTSLEELEVEMSLEPDPNPIVAASATKPLVLPRVKTLTCNLYNAQFLLPYVTLPFLTQLTTRDNTSERTVHVLPAFIARSGPPPLRKISISITAFPRDALLCTLEAIPDSVDDAEFTVKSQETFQLLFDILLLECPFPRGRFQVLPQLTTLRLQTQYIDHSVYFALLAMLQARSQITELVVLQRAYTSVGVDPSNEVIQGLRALRASRGLRVKLTMVERRPTRRLWTESRVVEI